MNTPIRAVIVDDHPIIRAGICSVLQSAEDICIVAQGENGEDALRLVAEHQPDVLVLDVNIPVLNGQSWLSPRVAGQVVRRAMGEERVDIRGGRKYPGCSGANDFDRNFNEPKI